MSYFGEALTELLERRNMTAVRLSELSGVDNAAISRLKNGDQAWVSPQDLTAIAKHISDNPRDRANLIKAHMLDERNGPGSELIEVSVRGETTAREMPLRSEAEKNFAEIRGWYVKDSRVREIIDNLGELLRESSGQSETDVDIADAVVPRKKKNGKSSS